MAQNNTALIQIQDLRFQWSSQAPLLNISAFDLKVGEKVFLFGPSGSGKTTLLNILTGVLAEYRGQVTLLGQSLSALSPSARDQFRGDHMGFIFQQFNLIPYLSVLQNIMLPLTFSEKKRRKLTDPESEARRLAAHLNLQDLLDRRATELSVGQQQRVAAARALIGSPELIIADEPTSSLDYNHRDQFLKLLLDEVQKSQSTLLFVSHDQTLQKHFDRTVALSEISKGRV